LSPGAGIVTIEHMFGLPLPEIARKWREMATPGGDRPAAARAEPIDVGAPASAEPDDDRAPGVEGYE
jgi:hypothetical protein